MDITRSQSGLILARESPDGAAIERALKQIDPALSLQAWPQPSGPPTWKVVLHVGSEQPPDTIVSWVDERLEPLPLGWGIVEFVKQYDRNAREQRLDADVKNELFKQGLDRNWERETDAAIGDWRFPHGRPVLPRTPGLVASRRRARREGKRHFG